MKKLISKKRGGDLLVGFRAGYDPKKQFPAGNGGIASSSM